MQLLYNLSFFFSSSSLSLIRACFFLSKLLINELYYCKDMVLCLCKGIKLMVDLTSYNYICWDVRSLSNQTSTALLTTALVIWLYYYLKERIPTLDGLLEVTITLLYIPLTIEYNTRFLLRTVQVFYVILLSCKVRSWMQCLSLVLCLYL